MSLKHEFRKWILTGGALLVLLVAVVGWMLRDAGRLEQQRTDRAQSTGSVATATSVIGYPGLLSGADTNGGVSGSTAQDQKTETPTGSTDVDTTSGGSEAAQVAAAVEADRLQAERSRKLGEEKKRFPNRLRNTDLPIGELVNNDDAILLRNAFIDVNRLMDYEVPGALAGSPYPGAYLVHSKSGITPGLKARIESMNGHIVSYIPNDTLLVNGMSKETVDALPSTGGPEELTILPFAPYYKLPESLLATVLDGQPMPSEWLRVTAFPGRSGTARNDLADSGAVFMGEESTPFGDQFIIKPGSTDVTKLAVMESVLAVDPYYPRQLANDLTRVALNISSNTLATTTNYLGLTGAGILVGVNDTGVDATNPDLAGRVSAKDASALVDVVGHGTHVAGTIASSGENSPVLTNNTFGSIQDADFRGMAPAALIFAQPIDLLTGPIVSDTYLQENAVRTNALISNNSWGYTFVSDYNFASASYDAAVRDGLNTEPGMQSITYVFAAGNDGQGSSDGAGGEPETVVAPGTAKNVITVGALEQFRFITNQVVLTNIVNGTNQIVTNTPFLFATDSSNQVAQFSSRGNVGIGIEGEFGRFKPDVVAPGSFVISTRSVDWVDPQGFGNTLVSQDTGKTVDANSTNFSTIYVPSNVSSVRIVLQPNDRSPVPFPSMQISAGPVNSIPLDRGAGDVTFDVSTGLWTYGVVNPLSQLVWYDVIVVYYLDEDPSQYFVVLKSMNDQLNYYRFASGTSMAAPSVSGMLALMHEFFIDRMSLTNSPALMKALLINGSRSVNNLYSFAVRDVINIQGWGRPNLEKSIPELLDENPLDPTGWPIQFFDQDPDLALATGQEQTRFVTLTKDALFFPLRATLVWTDPPGNPLAAIKLVNNLDLIVTNLDTGDVYFGNNINAGSDFTSSGTVDAADSVNNVENVFINAPLGTNYSVTVRATRVNINAVTAQLDNIVQDYALVISLGNETLDGAMTITDIPNTPPVPATQAPVVPVTLTTLGNGLPLFGERVSANPTYLTTPNGAASQWNFYVYTNTVALTNASATNFAVATFLPPNLGRSRNMKQGDLDLYLSTDPALTNLSAVAIGNAQKSLRRGGTESIQLTNSSAGIIYYIGVKSEDQQAVEYGLIAAATDEPFAECDERGCILRPIFPADPSIPDGTPELPGGIPLIFPGPPEQINVRRVIVTNTFTHQSPGDLLGDLSHDQEFVVLVNHRWPDDGLPLDASRGFIFDDSNEQGATGNPYPRVPSDGPGSLQNFTGKEGQGPWNYFMTDNSPNYTGRVDNITLWVERQPDLSEFAINLAPGECYLVSTNVYPGATNLSVTVSNLTSELDVFIRRDAIPTPSEYDKTALFSPPSGTVSIGARDVPPLSPGLYHILFCNPPTSGATIDAKGYVQVDYDLNDTGAKKFKPNDQVQLVDDALTNSVLIVTNFQQIADIEVGFRVEHHRAADLSIYLTSPEGTRVLLSENRGRTNTLGYGEGGPGTETLRERYSESFEAYRRGTYTNTQTFGPWTVLTDDAAIRFAPARAYTGVRLVSLSGGGSISNSLPTAPTTPTSQYDLFYAYRFPQLDAATPTAWYQLEDNADDSSGNNDGVLSGNPAFAPGEVGQALDADGINDYVMVSASPDLSSVTTAGLTINAWINPTDVSAQQPLVEWNDDSNTGPQFGVGANFWIGVPYADGGPGSLYANLVDISGIAHQISSAIDLIVTNQYQHVAVTYDKLSGEAQLYLDGSIIAQTNLGTFVPDTSTDLYLAYRPNGANAPARYEGGLDEVGIYGFALSQCEIQAIYNAGSLGLDGANFSGCGGGGSVQVTVDNSVVASHVATGAWQTGRVRFTASGPETPVEILGLGEGVDIDQLVLAEVLFDAPIVYTRFTENTNLALAPIKFGTPPYATNSLFVPVLQTDFENAVGGATDYPAITSVDQGWTVVTNSSAVIYDPPLALTNDNFLALADGQLLLTNFPTVIGNEYNISFAYRDNSIRSWWPGDQSALDVMEVNNGLFTPPRYAPGKVQSAFRFTGPGSVPVRFGDPQSLTFAQSFSIEGWINLTNNYPLSQAPVIARGDMAGNFPYFLSVRNDKSMVFHVADDTTNVVELVSGVIPTNVWVHVGATLDDVSGDMVIYLDGVSVARTNISFRSAGELNPANFPSTSIGAHLSATFEPLNGLVDELTVYDRALSESEIGAVFRADSNGKSGPLGGPHPEPVAAFSIGGVNTNVFVGSLIWNEVTYSFTADSTSADLMFEGSAHAMLIDQVLITETVTFNHFLTEDLLKPYVGQNAGGSWELTVWDNRVGQSLDARLISWTLDLVFANTNAGCIALKHAVPVTNSIPANSWQYYCVEVPRSASFATNVLFGSSGPVDLWWNQSGLPDGGAFAGDVEFLPGSLSGQATLGTNGLAVINNGGPETITGTPELLPGQRYYLGVNNVSGAPIDISIGVEFDLIDGITRTTNGVSVNKAILPGEELDYFQIDVSSNAIEVAFQIINADGDVDLLVTQGPTLPAVDHFDFSDGLAPLDTSSRNKLVLVGTNSTPALAGGRWYAAAWNRETNAVAYQMRITEIYAYDPATLLPTVGTITTLTNGVGLGSTQPAGVSLTNFFKFSITNSERAALFEVYGVDEDVDLLLRRDLLPSIVSFYRISARGTLNPEQIVLRTNALLPDLNGDWYIGVPNNGYSPANFTVRAVVPTAGGILPGGEPPRIFNLAVIPVNLLQFWFTTLDGENYEVQYTADLTAPIAWTVGATLNAAGPEMLYSDPTAIAPSPPAPPMRYYRIQQVP